MINNPCEHYCPMLCTTLRVKFLVCLTWNKCSWFLMVSQCIVFHEAVDYIYCAYENNIEKKNVFVNTLFLFYVYSVSMYPFCRVYFCLGWIDYITLPISLDSTEQLPFRSLFWFNAWEFVLHHPCFNLCSEIKISFSKEISVKIQRMQSVENKLQLQGEKELQQLQW